MKNNNNSDNKTQSPNIENQAAALAVIAGLFSTLGEGIATISTALALQEVQQNNQERDYKKVNIDLKNIEKKIDNLEREIIQIKKILLSKRS
ncbi:hypothetical protein [Ureibacillus sinduriensis]|uniref:Translation initiation factor 2 n=1 Tax=Ureibacillus sinduriensis BLB-1 = JCM 15800 TaxID=1384057 RepID=A0A0A3I214_9BACL|nr:hypothetical protein [Ureibacillus sinduriensis]KGR77550.1 hypothetical protein CD33_02470 [Ureibacillus sinduriensis BLB-1 = JCM 15800]